MEHSNGISIHSVKKMLFNSPARLALAYLEQNSMPDFVVRRKIRILLAGRLRTFYRSSTVEQLSNLMHFAKSLREMPIAINTDKPKSQMYEVPTSFFELVLGKKLKYSCCFFPDKSSTLEDAEKAMLELYCERSRIQDGHSVLDLGCGWGSLTMYLAQKYPNSKITGICYSVTQKAYIDRRSSDLQLKNVETIVADISIFDMEASYDRIFSCPIFHSPYHLPKTPPTIN